MTRVLIFKKKDRISGFEISGHTGYAEEGSDIVCSAVSSVSQMALLGVDSNEIARLEAENGDS